MTYTNPQLAAPAIRAAIEQAERIIILSHVNPDGDAIGSILGIWHALQSMGKTALPIASSDIPSYTEWLPGAEHVQVYRRGSSLPAADLIIMADTANLPRVGAIYDDHAAQLQATRIAIIDHHVTNDDNGELNLIAPTSASTCELLYELFTAMGIELTPEAATCLMMGIVTDTQSFQTSATKPGSLRATAALLECGGDYQRIVREVYFRLPASSAALIGMALATLQVQDGMAWVTISREMMAATNAEDEASDEVVKVMQRIAGVRALAMFKGRSDGTTKISLRSVPPLNVAAIAQIWGGGGHAQAAGATLPMPPEAAAEAVLPELRAILDRP